MKNNKKAKAVALLRKHDTLKAQLRLLERDMQKAVTEYGVSTGVWGLSADKFRLQLQMEAEREQKEKHYHA